MPFRILPIVEGDGEVRAVGLLFRRLIAEFNPSIPIVISRPWRQARGTLLKEGGIASVVDSACIAMDGPGAVVVLLDSEGECPAELAPILLTRSQRAARQASYPGSRSPRV
jgi:hypothetical protein